MFEFIPTYYEWDIYKDGELIYTVDSEDISDIIDEYESTRDIRCIEYGIYNLIASLKYDDEFQAELTEQEQAELIKTIGKAIEIKYDLPEVCYV